MVAWCFQLDLPALMILLAKLFGIYFKNLFICIDEFILQVPDILDILGRFLVFTMVYYALMEDWTIVNVTW